MAAGDDRPAARLSGLKVGAHQYCSGSPQYRRSLPNNLDERRLDDKRPGSAVRGLLGRATRAILQPDLDLGDGARHRRDDAPGDKEPEGVSYAEEDAGGVEALAAAGL